MKKQIKENILHKFEFTATELQALGLECARCTTDVNELKDQAKSVASDYKAKVDQKESQRNLIAGKLNSGYEMREVEAIVEFDYPNGTKDYLHPVTLEFLRRAEMTHADRQMPMFEDAEFQ